MWCHLWSQISFLDILSVGKKLLSEGEPSVNQSRLPEELDYKLKFRIQNREFFHFLI
jgi:hypothetical protein